MKPHTVKSEKMNDKEEKLEAMSTDDDIIIDPLGDGNCEWECIDEQGSSDEAEGNKAEDIPDVSPDANQWKCIDEVVDEESRDHKHTSSRRRKRSPSPPPTKKHK